MSLNGREASHFGGEGSVVGATIAPNIDQVDAEKHSGLQIVGFLQASCSTS